MRQLLAALVVLGVGPAPVQAVAPHVGSEALVRFEAHTTKAERDALLHRVGADRIETLGSTGVVRVRFAGVTTAAAIERLAAQAGILYVEPNFMLEAEPVEFVAAIQHDGLVAVPDDAMFPQQWALDNRGQTGGTPGADVDAVSAWDLATGSSEVLVALVDTGLDFAHPDLAAQAWTNPGEVPGNNLDDDGNGFIDDVRGWDFVNSDADPIDDNGHGTLLAGSLGAVGNNAMGITGVAWTLRIAAVKFLNASGTGTTAQAIQAVDYARRIGADVILGGWGGGAFSPALRDVIAAAGDAGIPFVAPAGGSGTNLDNSPVYPASYALANVVAVAATDANDGLASFSNWGPMTVDLGAPGVGILTTLLGGSYVVVSGTASAAAHVAGGLALMENLFPSLNAEFAIEHLIAWTDFVPALEGRVRSEGRLNVWRPLAAVMPADTSERDMAPVGAVDAWWIASEDVGARVGFVLSRNSDVRLEIFDVRGRRVQRALLGQRFVGTHTWDWNGRDARGDAVARGVYIVRLAAQGVATTRIVLGN